MADFTKFRTSIGGFNRSDVSDYMTKICAEHQSVLRQNQKETAALVQKLEATELALDDAVAQLEQLKAALEEKTMENMRLRSDLEAAEVLLATQTPSDEDEEDVLPPDYAVMELEAYRRAEAMERASQERSVRMRRKIGDFLDTLSARYEQTGQEVEALSEDICTSLNRLQEALSDLDQIFEEANNQFDTLDADEVPEEE